MNELVSIVIIHRHGARLPQINDPGNMSFPQSNLFWKDHSMLLTPKGSKQLKAVGKSLRKEFDDFVINIPIKNIKCYSTNTGRTIQSLLAFLDGFLPSIPYNISCEKTNINNSIKISIDEEDNLFRNKKLLKSIDKWSYHNYITSDIIIKSCKNNNIINLLDKLYIMTKNPKLSPTIQIEKRLYNIKEYISLIRYSEVHNIPLIPNIYNITLNEDEKILIKNLSSLIYQHQFIDNKILENNNYICSNNEKGLLYVKRLLEKINKFLNKNINAIRIYSCHDTTLLALAASFHMIIPVPNFASYFIIEKYSNNTILLKFNPEPFIYNYNDLKSYSWKL